MKPQISVIIPCYNGGAFLPEALESLSQTPGDIAYEVVIVDDGSTDKHTLSLFEDLRLKGFTVISQQNKGCGGARNTGIRHAKANYLLFLDADNKVYSAYLKKGIAILDAHPEVGVVYGNPKFFGDSTEPRFWPAEYDLLRMVGGNYIDVCTVVRKKMWEDLGGFEETRLMNGHEDWELWIRAGAAGWKFEYLDEELFEYRIRNNSLVVEQQEDDKIKKVQHYIFNKHFNLFIDSYNDLKSKYQIYQNDQARPMRSFVKFSLNKLNNRSV